MVITGWMDGCVRFYRMNTSSLLQRSLQGASEPISCDAAAVLQVHDRDCNSVDWSAQGHLYTGSVDRTAKEWIINPDHLAESYCSKVFGRHTGEVLVVRVDRAGEYVVTGCENGEVYIFPTSSTPALEAVPCVSADPALHRVISPRGLHLEISPRLEFL